MSRERCAERVDGGFPLAADRSAPRGACQGMGTPLSLLTLHSASPNWSAYCVIVPQAMRSPAFPAGSDLRSSGFA